MWSQLEAVERLSIRCNSAPREPVGKKNRWGQLEWQLHINTEFKNNSIFFIILQKVSRISAHADRFLKLFHEHFFTLKNRDKKVIEM